MPRYSRCPAYRAKSKPIWFEHGEFEVSLREFHDDFRTIVAQLADEVEGADWERWSWIVPVRVRPYDDFVTWVKGMEPDWDRYRYYGVEELVNRGLLPRAVITEPGRYDRKIPELKLVGLTEDDVYRIGYERYLDDLTDAICKGVPIPPLVTLNGEPVDGRHRTLAALKLGLRQAPVMEVAEVR